MSSQLPPPPSQSPDGRGERYVSYSSVPSAKPGTGSWWPVSQWGNVQKATAAVIGGLTVVVVLALSAGSGEEEKSKPSGGTELCEIMRDPEYRRLTRGDFERLADMTDYELQRYVAARCPEQMDRVD